MAGWSVRPFEGAPRARARVAALAVLAVLGLAACSGRVPPPTGAPTSSGPTPGASATPAPTVAPTPAPTLGPGAGLTWVTVAGQPSFDGAMILGVAAGPAGIVAIGWAEMEVNGVPEQRTSAWRSSDGVAWARSGMSFVDLTRPETPLTLSAVSWSDRGFVAVGDNLAWTSGDGERWSAVELGPATPRTGACASAVAARPGTVVATGSFGPCGSGGSRKPAAWVALADGGWQVARIVGPEGAFGSFDGIVAGSSGFVAYGGVSAVDARCDTCPPPDPELYVGAPWFSADGLTWTKVTDVKPFRSATISGIVAGGPGFVAVGTEALGMSGPFTTVVWTSTDGRTWQRVDASRLAAAADARIGGGGRSLVIRSTDPAPDGTVRTRLWASADGLAWTDLGWRTAFVGRQVRGMMATWTGLIAFGGGMIPDPGATCDKADVVAGRCHQAGAIWFSPVGAGQ